MGAVDMLETDPNNLLWTVGGEEEEEEEGGSSDTAGHVAKAAKISHDNIHREACAGFFTPSTAILQCLQNLRVIPYSAAEKGLLRMAMGVTPAALSKPLNKRSKAHKAGRRRRAAGLSSA